MLTVPIPITALPVPPSTGSPSDFDIKADAFLGALPVHTTETNTLSTTNYTNAIEAYNAALTATTQANLAAASAALASANATASVWVSGTTYALGQVVISPLSLLLYRRVISGAGTTDPSLDSTNWTLALQQSAGSSLYLFTNFGGF